MVPDELCEAILMSPSIALSDGFDIATVAKEAAEIFRHNTEGDSEQGWNCIVKDSHTIEFISVVHDTEIKYTVDITGIYKRIVERNRSLINDIQHLFGNGAVQLNIGESIVLCKAPSDLIDYVMEVSKKRVYIQRFKGLGEMNPEQLWDTTLNPENRVLLQLKVSDCQMADEIFTILMGDVVEPRKKFINDNALKVEQVDV
jgi:DNA gyrase subunit B